MLRSLDSTRVLLILRKQTLFLLLAVIVCALGLFFPIGSIAPEGMGTDSMVYNLGVVTGEGGLAVSATCIPLFVLLSVTAILSLVTIFLYKNRKVQMSICKCTMLLQVLWVIDYVLILLGIIPIPEVQGKMGIEFAACLPIVSLILVAMAYKGVNDDEKLVKAADRIR